MYVNGKFYTHTNSNIVPSYMRTRVNGMPVEKQTQKGSSWLVLEPIHCSKILFSTDKFELAVTYAKAYADQMKEIQNTI